MAPSMPNLQWCFCHWLNSHSIVTDDRMQLATNNGATLAAVTIYGEGCNAVATREENSGPAQITRLKSTTATVRPVRWQQLQSTELVTVLPVSPTRPSWQWQMRCTAYSCQMQIRQPVAVKAVVASNIIAAEPPRSLT